MVQGMPLWRFETGIQLTAIQGYCPETPNAAMLFISKIEV
jgi:hypothetical protein